MSLETSRLQSKLIARSRRQLHAHHFAVPKDMPGFALLLVQYDLLSDTSERHATVTISSLRHAGPR